jgi:hypothetical protein
MRLQACRQALADASFQRYFVAGIAYRFGLKNPAHFSQAFKIVSCLNLRLTNPCINSTTHITLSFYTLC